MDQSLEKSLEMLQNAISSSSMIRPSRNTTRDFRSFMTDDNTSFIYNYEFPTTGMDSPSEMEDDRVSVRSSLMRTFNPESIVGNSALHLHEVQNGISEKLFTEFFEIIAIYKSQPQILQVIGDVMQTCSDTIDVLRSMRLKSAGNAKSVIDEQCVWLESERNTWRLMYCLYQDRFVYQEMESCADVPLHWTSEKQCVDNLYRSDALIRECQLIVDWLERNECDSLRKHDVLYSQQYTYKTIGWENTLHQLEDRTTMAFPSDKQIVTEMDPDASTRQKRPIHDLDADDDEHLCKQLFYYIRCGQLNEAVNLCDYSGQKWRAILLQGWKLYHDPNYFTDKSEETLMSDGNPDRDLWKKTTWRLCNRTDLNKYWRGTLAAFSGNLPALLNVCDTWEDRLWAYLKVMIDIKVELEIRDNIMHRYRDMPDDYWTNKNSLNDIFEKLSNAYNESVDDNVKYQRVIQRFLIMDLPQELIEFVTETTRALIGDSDAEGKVAILKNHGHLLRMFAHLVIIMREIVKLTANNGEYILEIYVQTLIALDLKDIVAFYISHLSESNQIQYFRDFLIKCNACDNDTRRMLLESATRAGLDVELISKNAVETILQQNRTRTDVESCEKITDEDRFQIRAIDWLLFYDNQRFDAIYCANMLIRYFLSGEKLEAVRVVFATLSPDLVDDILALYNDDGNEAPVAIRSTIREFVCYKLYLDAHSSFNEWLHYFHSSKPVKPEMPNLESLRFTEKIALDHRMSAYNDELERWNATMSYRTKTTKGFLYNVLLFPGNGWLVDTDSNREEPAESQRLLQMAALRKICIPQVVLLLHTILHETGQFQECMKIADLIAGENKQLYKEFSKQKLSEFLTKIYESSLALMEMNKDPWGYEMIKN